MCIRDIESISWYPREDSGSRELVLNFMLLFSRLEYAMKCTYKYSNSSRGYFQADWDELARSLAPHQFPVDEKWHYIKQHPPKKQIAPEEWSKVSFHEDWVSAIKCLKTIRNNLFHGGKHPETGFMLEKIRDRKLVESAIFIIEAILVVAPEKIRNKCL